MTSALEGLPEYTPEEAAVFDDVLSAAIFGVRPEIDPAKDPNMAARVGRADWVARARISTISKEMLAGKDGYTLSVSPEGGTIGGTQAATAVELRVPRGSPAFLRLDTMPESIIGKRLIIFVRQYADRGEAASHWHGEADDPAIVSLIERQKNLNAQGARAQTKD